MPDPKPGQQPRPANDSTKKDRRPSIVIDGLRKNFGAVQAVAGVSFEVLSGEVFGLLGPNGAGKTTILRVLTGRSRPTSGHALVGGFDVVTRRREAVQQLGVVFEDPNVYERLSGGANLRFFADLYGLPRARISEALDLVKLDTQAARRPVRTYSTGMRQRLLIARALLNRPPILLLDEPTRGLDPLTARELRELIIELRHSGSTIVLTTHILDEADQLCDRIAFLRSGELVALASPQALKRPGDACTAEVVLSDDAQHQVQLNNAADAERLRTWISMGKVRAIHSQEPTLEDVFVRLARSSEVDGTASSAAGTSTLDRTGAVGHEVGDREIGVSLHELTRWLRVVSRIGWEELCGTVRNGHWLLLVLLLAAAGSCTAVRSSAAHTVVRVAYAADQATDVLPLLSTAVDPSMTIQLTAEQGIDGVRDAVDQQHATLGLVFPADLDAALKEGQTPAITVVHRAQVDADTAAVIAALTPALQLESGRPGPANIIEETRPAAATGLAGVVERLGGAGLFAALSLMLLLACIGTTIVPKLLHEEVDKKTLSALLLVASPGQVLVGKGLTGIVYMALALPLAVAASGLPVAEPVALGAGIALFAAWLVELGLVLGLVVDRRTYEGLGPIVSLAVLLGPVIAASQVGSAGLGVLAMAWPTVAASWLLLDALSGVTLYTAGLWAVGVLIVWVVVSYVALVAILNRQEL